MDVERRLVAILIQLSVIIVVARVFALLFRKIKQPAAVGEIAAGLFLGPSFLGWILPGVSRFIFLPDSDPVGLDATITLQVISQLGLILLLFLIGLEFDFSHLKKNVKSAFGISLAGIVIPMALGIGLARVLYPHLGQGIEERSFTLFMGISMSITALPVLARMMQELRITRTRVGAITITAAASDDAIGWILLATVSALVTAHFEIWTTLRMIALTIAFALFLIYVAKPYLGRLVASSMRNDGEVLGPMLLAIILAILFLCSIITSVIGIFAIFGAFLLGAVLSDQEKFRTAAAHTFQNFVMTFFLPIFFTFTGLRTNVVLLGGSTLWLFVLLILITAVTGKFGGCSIAARLTGFSWKESMLVGSMMNTRGLMELIVLNVGYELGVIPQNLFTMLVLMALFTTLMTTPLLYLFRRNTELESYLQNWWRGR